MRPNIERDAIRIGGLQHPHLARDPPIGPPAFGDQFRIGVGTGDAQGGQIHMEPGSIDPEGLYRGQCRGTAHAFTHRSKRFQRPTQPIVVEQHPGDT